MAQSVDNNEMLFSKKRIVVDRQDDDVDRKSELNNAVTKKSDGRLKNPKGLQIEVIDDSSETM